MGKRKGKASAAAASAEGAAASAAAPTTTTTTSTTPSQPTQSSLQSQATQQKAQQKAQQPQPQPQPQAGSKRSLSEIDEERAQKRQKLAENKDVSRYVNKQRTLVLCSRGTSFRGRHLMDDMLALMAHGKKESKLDTKHDFTLLNELAVLKNCNNVIFFETRKHHDVYMWVSKTPSGPSAKFLVQNAHTMAETKLTGNCLKGSRPLLVFDHAFGPSSSAFASASSTASSTSTSATTPAPGGGAAHMLLLKELFTQAMGTPKGHPKAQPFIDHVFSFFYVDHRIWFRNYQIVYEGEKVGEVQAGADPAVARNGQAQPILVEVGPRFVLNPIRIFGGSFGGPVLWENPRYVSPNELRSRLRRMQGDKYAQRKESEQVAEAHKANAAMADHPVDEVFHQGLTGARLDFASLAAAQAASASQALAEART